MQSKLFFNQIHSLVHSHHWNPDIIEYYIFKVLRDIGFSLLTLFVPIFLYADLGYSIFQIMLVFIINQMFFLICVPFSGKIIQWIGVKHSMLLQLPGFILFAYGLQFLSGNFVADLGLITLLFALRACPKTPFFTAENLFIAKNILKNKKAQGKSLAVLKIILILASLVSPLVGGLVTYFFGFEALFNMAIIILFIAAIPMLFGKDKHYEIKETVSEVVFFTWKKVSKFFHLAELGRQGPRSLLFLLWPLFLYIIVENTMELGILVSVSAFVAMIVSYFIGKIIDKHEPDTLIKYGSRASSLVFFLRGVFPSPIVLAITDALNNIINPILDIPYEKKYYQYLNSFKSSIEVFVSSNLVMEIYATLTFTLLAIVFGALEFFNMEVTTDVFLFIFIFYSFFFFLMQNILKVKKGNSYFPVLSV